MHKLYIYMRESDENPVIKIYDKETAVEVYLTLVKVAYMVKLEYVKGS